MDIKIVVYSHNEKLLSDKIWRHKMDESQNNYIV